MKRVFSILTILLFTLNAIAQSDKNKIIVVQKFYKDTLQTDYRKVKYEISKNANKVTRFDYSSAHISDTIIVRKTTKYKFENGRFFNSERNTRRISNRETHKVGDTIFEKKTDYLTKKIYSKNKIIYASRLFKEQQSIPYNEQKYIYNKNGNLIKIQEKYNSDVNEEYKTIFEYKNGIVSRMTEFKKSGEKWTKEKIWRYELLTKYKLKKKIRKRINNLLLTNQFTETPW